jgi:hypothetical protein
MFVAIAILTMLSSCSKPVIVSGMDLPIEDRTQLSLGGGIRLDELDGEKINGRRFVLAPGTYSIAASSKRDLEDVNSALKGAVEILECKFEVALQPGEEIHVSSRLKKGKGRFSKGYDMTGFHTVVRLDSSIDERSRVLEPYECEDRIDCRKVDRSQVIPVGC